VGPSRQVATLTEADLQIAPATLGESERDAKLTPHRKPCSASNGITCAGALTVEEWRRFEAKLTDELAAARAAVDRAQEHVHGLEHGDVDAEEDQPLPPGQISGLAERPGLRA